VGVTEISNFLPKLAGVGLLLFGVWIIVIFWVYHLRHLAALAGMATAPKFSSMAPAVGPGSLLLGAYLFGEPVSHYVGWWVWLVDTNTYAFIFSLPYLFRELWRSR
jgi:hypothetical protein